MRKFRFTHLLHPARLAWCFMWVSLSLCLVVAALAWWETRALLRAVEEKVLSLEDRGQLR